MAVRNRVQLITYPDGLGGSLRGLGDALDEHFPGLFEGGIHILPPFPSSGDRGFAPLTYDAIDPRFGDWEDVRRLGERYDILLDLMVNHISSRSPQFADFRARGRASEWADLFVTLDKFWPDGRPVEADVDRIFLRRPRPYSTFEVGLPPVTETVWTSFGKQDPSEQIDLDWRSPRFRSLVEAFFDTFAAHGIRMVRLDAVGYLVKKIGTSCFFVEPEIWDLLGWLEDQAERRGIALLPEVHGTRKIGEKLVRHGYWTYDFILPYRVLEALVLRTPARLREYLATRPHRQFTMLDCHDGIPLKPDLDGLYDPAEARRVVGVCESRGGNMSTVYSAGHRDPDGFDVHQIRGTLYSLLGGDDDACVAARAIQLFAPGVPQVYYVGLLAGENDLDAAARTGDGREANRHNFSAQEIREAACKEVVRRLIRLIRLRNSHPAFDGEFRPLPSPDDRLRLSWTRDASTCTLEVDFRTLQSHVELTDPQGERSRIDL
jgi:sucrose 6(F)-phosphate phosphorylase